MYTLTQYRRTQTRRISRKRKRSTGSPTTPRTTHLSRKAQPRVPLHLGVRAEPMQKGAQQEVSVAVEVPPGQDRRSPSRSDVSEGESLREGELRQGGDLQVHVLDRLGSARAPWNEGGGGIS